jgi:hypothetical protein
LLIERAFAGDNVVEEEFVQEKAALVDRETIKDEDVTVPGWYVAHPASCGVGAPLICSDAHIVSDYDVTFYQGILGRHRNRASEEAQIHQEGTKAGVCSLPCLGLYENV